MEITIQAPPSNIAEKKYIIEVLFRIFLGLNYQVQFNASKNYIIKIDKKNTIIFPDIFFANLDNNWLKTESLPRLPLKFLQFTEPFIRNCLLKQELPIIFGKSADFMHIQTNEIQLPFDLFGSAFFMLSRYEEVVNQIEDDHARFPARASLAFQAGFLDRPIINEYMEIFKCCINYLNPQIHFRKHEFKIIPTHDVDKIFKYNCSLAGILKIMAGDILKRHKIKLALKTLHNWNETRQKIQTIGLLNIFDIIMELSEKNNLKSIFYFLADNTEGKPDGDYDINHPLVINLIKQIHSRGHEVGLHLSYNTLNNKQQITKEYTKFLSILEKLQLNQDRIGCRAHFLRWDTRQSFKILNDLGLHYDTTLSFADHAGFRCGICYEYPAYDLINRETLSIYEYPLIAMECSVIDEKYMNLGLNNNAALNVFSSLKQACQKYGGNFILLWHNTRFVDEKEMVIYRQILS